MKSKSIKVLQILAGIYAALYLVMLIGLFFEGAVSFSNLKDYLFILLFLVFLAGFLLSWTRENIAGIIFMFWNAACWIFDLCLFRGKDSGMFSIMAVPVLIIGAMLLLRWYKKNTVPVLPERLQWRFILRVLIINYAVLYGIVVISELAAGLHHDYFHLPFIIFPLSLIVFLLGFTLSWKREFMAGIILLFWCAIMTAGFIAYTELFNSGPWILFGIPILLQGLFYIKNHSMYKSEK